LLAAALVAAACSSGPETSHADAPRASEIRALRWLAPGADKVRFLTAMPASCETPATGADARRRLLGKLAFESPALLGGAAARMGLSCSSCHLNGRGNPGFFIEGVSDRPGAADVTSSLLSKVRGDGNFNPVAIPDIGLRDGKQIRDRRSPEFQAKVRGLVVEEFDGQEPPAEVFDALIEYLDGLEPGWCRNGEEAVDVDQDLKAAQMAYEIAQNSDSAPETRVFYLRAARFRLERIHERLPQEDQGGLRRELVKMSADLGSRAESIRMSQPVEAPEPDWETLRTQLHSAAGRSYYDPGVLRQALEAS
jgi:hypothetical protein